MGYSLVRAVPCHDLSLHPPKDRKTMELMSQTGLDLRDLIADKENNTSPVEAMRAIMTRGKEKGWTTAKLFGVFLEVRR